MFTQIGLLRNCAHSRTCVAFDARDAAIGLLSMAHVVVHAEMKIRPATRTLVPAREEVALIQRRRS